MVIRGLHIWPGEIGTVKILTRKLLMEGHYFNLASMLKVDFYECYFCRPTAKLAVFEVFSLIEEIVLI